MISQNYIFFYIILNYVTALQLLVVAGRSWGTLQPWTRNILAFVFEVKKFYKF